MWNLLVFAAIGLLAGAAARVMYPRRQLTHTLGTMLLGMTGAVAGALFSWLWWPDVAGVFQSGNLLMSFFGAAIAIGLWAGVAYQRSIVGYTTRQ
jgi:uncharacterized membrane protein YeaQ/YmgE (transglycosylase-associated protein family)